MRGVQMKKIEQIVVKRESHKRDEGTMGFHDYVMVKEDFAESWIEQRKFVKQLMGKF